MARKRIKPRSEFVKALNLSTPKHNTIDVEKIRGIIDHIIYRYINPHSNMEADNIEKNGILIRNQLSKNELIVIREFGYLVDSSLSVGHWINIPIYPASGEISPSPYREMSERFGEDILFNIYTADTARGIIKEAREHVDAYNKIIDTMLDAWNDKKSDHIRINLCDYVQFGELGFFWDVMDLMGYQSVVIDEDENRNRELWEISWRLK